MASKEVTKNGEKTENRDVAIAQSAAASIAATAEIPRGWVRVGGDRLIYKAEKCHDTPVVGILLGHQELNGDTPWYAFIVRLTRPTKAVDQEGVVRDVEAGNEVYVPETHRLMDLRKAASHPDRAFEVFIRPTRPLSIGGGRTMWLYDIAVNPREIVRTADMKIFVQKPEAPPLPATPTQTNFDDSVPFS